MVEHRHGVRRRAFALAEIFTKSGIHLTGLIYNVSRDGMFILTDSKVHIRGYVEIHLPKIIRDNKPFKISGLVIHHSGIGFGLMFSRATNETIEFVDKLSLHMI